MQDDRPTSPTTTSRPRARLAPPARAVAAALFLGLLSTLAAAPAHAADGCSDGYCHIERSSGRGHFWSDGDTFRADDDSQDGKSVGVRWKYRKKGAKVHTLRNTGGAGSSQTWRPNLSEGTTIALQYCHWSDGERTCTAALTAPT